MPGLQQLLEGSTTLEISIMLESAKFTTETRRHGEDKRKGKNVSA
jgi:hypothetical protein